MYSIKRVLIIIVLSMSLLMGCTKRYSSGLEDELNMYFKNVPENLNVLSYTKCEKIGVLVNVKYTESFSDETESYLVDRSVECKILFTYYDNKLEEVGGYMLLQNINH